MAPPTTIVSPWRMPTPHEVLVFVFVFACGLRESGIFADGSLGARLCMAVYIACALLGVNAARNYVSPRVQSILNEHDACPHPKPEELKPPS